jgi:hypothetical protein
MMRMLTLQKKNKTLILKMKRPKMMMTRKKATCLAKNFTSKVAVVNHHGRHLKSIAERPCVRHSIASFVFWS